MGVIKFFSSDSRDCESNKSKPVYHVKAENIEIVNSTPDPTNFNVKKIEIINGYPILLVNYPDVENYEGNKILMYPKFFNMDTIKKRIDPHFLQEGIHP